MIKFISPTWLGIMAGLIAIISTFFPKNLYVHIIREDYFMDKPIVKYFIISCVISFLLGTALWNITRKIPSLAFRHKITFTEGAAAAVTLFSILLNVMQTLVIVRSVGLSGAIGTADSRLEINDALASYGLGWIIFFQLGLWCYLSWFFRFKGKRSFKALLALGVIIEFISLISLKNRAPVLYMIFIMMIPHIANIDSTKVISSIKQFWKISAGILLGALISVFVQLNRSGASSSISENIIGYFIASYNRLAAIMHNELIIPNSGSTFYVLQWVWTFPLLGNALSLMDYGRDLGLNLPISDMENWRKSFDVMYTYNLNPRYIWATTFGYAYADLGWYSTVWFFLYGFFSAVFWKKFLDRNLTGLVVYPYIALSIINWYSTAGISSRNIVSVFCAAIFIFTTNVLFNHIRRKQ